MKPVYAVILCTRNRTDDLARTLESIAAQGRDGERLLVVVDASDAAQAEQNRALTDAHTASPRHYLRFSDAPSLARQRNAGLDALPASVEVVHFVDDDVTLQPDYFRRLNAVFEQDRSVGGVGGRIVQPVRRRPGGLPWRRLFLLDHPAPGRVLPSGATTPAQTLPLKARADVAWLSGCSSAYRRPLLDRHRFDPQLEGYSYDEDLDLSYRLGRGARLLVEPRAVLVHHCSSKNRYDAERMACTALVHRYWFVEKNLRHPLNKAAFWWAVLGRLLAAMTSSRPEARAALRGLRQGIRTIRRRGHPLLRFRQPTQSASATP